jgi:hypothetical protein
MNKRLATTFAILLLCVFVVNSSTVSAANGLKKIDAYFKNIKIYVNGKQQTTDLEPFIYGNVTYVPIRLIATALNKNVYWDQATNSVKINDKEQTTIDDVTNLQNQLTLKENQLNQLRYENAVLRTKISDLEKELSDSKRYSGKDAAKDLRAYLKDEYSRWNRMDFKFDVEGDEDDLELTIKIDLDKYNSRWEDTKTGDIEDWLEDIYDYVEDNYPDANFSGTIEDTYKNKTLVKFWESRGKIKIEFKDSKSSSDFYDLEDSLNDKYGRKLDKYNKRFGDLRADIKVKGNDRNETIDITIEVDTSKYKTEWKDVRETRYAEDWLEDIAIYAQEEYDDYVIYGEVQDEKGKTMATFEMSSSGKIKFDWDYSY